ncbi:MAG TPA: hypothetical protein VHK69_07970 [Chitinophagaceae bacterium]|jgi:hypothetical protein|nr:hypothetical protein [Chitinophagaceae bacterium]
MNRTVPFVFLFLLACLPGRPLTGHSQAPPVRVWDKVMGGAEGDYATMILPGANGSYLLAGTIGVRTTNPATPNFSIINPKIYLVKMDAAGNELWTRTFGGSEAEYPGGVIATTDGGYLVYASSYSPVSGNKTAPLKGGYDFWLIKLDASGNKQWDKSYGGNSDDQALTAIATEDGGYLVGGTSRTDANGDKSGASRGSYDYWILKLDASGNKQWDKTYGGNFEDRLVSIQKPQNGGYLLVGHSNAWVSGTKTLAGNGDHDYWLVRIDAAGNKLWEKTLGGTGRDWLTSAIPTDEGGYLLGGWSESPASGEKTGASRGGRDYWVVKTDSLGNREWDVTAGGSSNEELYDLLPVAGGYLLGGWSASGISGEKTAARKGLEDYWLVQLGSSGAIQWNKTFGGNDEDELQDMATTPDGGLLLFGNSWSSVSGDKSVPGISGSMDWWLVKAGPSYSIQTGSLVSATICAGSTVQVPYTATGTYNGNNTFMTQLSDASGSFAFPRNLALISSTALSGAISSEIPVNTPPGTGYRIRVVSGSPAFTGADNGVNLAITAPLQAGISGTATVCPGNRLALSATEVTGAAYAWTGPAGFTATTREITVDSMAASKAGLYSVTVTKSGCSATASSTVTVPAAPVAQAGPDRTVCSGATVTLGAAPVSGHTYSWTSDHGEFASASANPDVTPSATITYTLKETITATGCFRTDTVTITVKPVPARPIISAGGSTTICEGTGVTLTSSSPETSQWFRDGVAIPGATAQTYGAESAGRYTVQATRDQCPSPVSAETTVVVNARPAVPVITAAGNVLTSSAATGNQWLLNAVPVPGATAQQHAVQSAGNYTVQVTVDNCSSVSLPFAFVATALVNPAAWNGEVLAYPNPVRGTLFLKNSGGRHLRLQLMDGTGTIVRTGLLTAVSGSLHLEGLPAGVYQLLLTDLRRKETLVIPVVKQ